MGGKRIANKFIDNVEHKFCKKCEDWKPLDDMIPKNYVCKVCWYGRCAVYYRDNQEELNEYSREYRAQNREQTNGYSKKWREANPKQMKSARKKWKIENPHKQAMYESKRRAKTNVVLTENEQKKVDLLFQVRDYLNTGDDVWEVDHIIPISKGGPHHPDNLQVIPESVNGSKHAKQKYDVGWRHWRI